MGGYVSRRKSESNRGKFPPDRTRHLKMGTWGEFRKKKKLHRLRFRTSRSLKCGPRRSRMGKDACVRGTKRQDRVIMSLQLGSTSSSSSLASPFPFRGRNVRPRIWARRRTCRQTGRGRTVTTCCHLRSLWFPAGRRWRQHRLRLDACQARTVDPSCVCNGDARRRRQSRCMIFRRRELQS